MMANPCVSCERAEQMEGVLDKTFKDRFRYILPGIAVAILWVSGATATEIDGQQGFGASPVIVKLKPERETGRGYQLSYMIDAPIDVVWKFKTDFDNQFLLSNKFFTSHRLVSQDRDEVITENVYSNKPKATFRWRTTLSADRYLLEFTLLNPEECGQKYHYGHIQLEAAGARTRVRQVAYFDFFGVSFWVNYPFSGGMSSFLKYTAAWEQQTVLDLKDEYE